LVATGRDDADINGPHDSDRRVKGARGELAGYGGGPHVSHQARTGGEMGCAGVRGMARVRAG
jgi:hypothetical protein